MAAGMDLAAWLRRHGAALQRAAACRDDPWQMDAPGDGPDAKAIADTAVELTAPSPAPLSSPASSPSAAAEAGAGVGADVQLQDPPPAVLDLRPRADFEAGHLPGASHFELHVLAEDEAPPAPPPPSDLRHRSSELPAPAARAGMHRCIDYYYRCCCVSLLSDPVSPALEPPPSTAGAGRRRGAGCTGRCPPGPHAAVACGGHVCGCNAGLGGGGGAVRTGA